VPPLAFYLFLVGAVAAYLLLVELAKRAFFRHFVPRTRGPGRGPPRADPLLGI
jgi:hypothetical protein